MMWTHPKDTVRQFQQNFLLAPLELKAFVVFTFVAAVFGFFVVDLLPKSVVETLIPVTGWVPFMSYAHPCMFVLMSLATKFYNGKFMRGHYIPILFLALNIYHGYVGMTLWQGVEHSNPYLRVSEWRPVYAIVLPLCWIIVLLSPRVTKFYDSLASKYNSSRLPTTSQG